MNKKKIPLAFLFKNVVWLVIGGVQVGVRASSRIPDTLHPYGHAQERYIFGLISGMHVDVYVWSVDDTSETTVLTTFFCVTKTGVGIFFLGCGVTIYHGVSLLLESNHVRCCCDCCDFDWGRE